MKQLIQNIKSGKISIIDAPAPICEENGVLIKNIYSIISSGTESKSVNTAKSSLIGKAINRPDLTKQVINLAKKQGIKSTYKLVQDRLNSISPLGYSCVGKVMEIGNKVSNIKVGDYVSCGGVGYASHSELNYVPINLVAKIPEKVDLKDAVYTTLGAISAQGVRRANIQVGENVLIIGLGLIGQLTNQILKAAGCKVIGVDMTENQLLVSKKHIDYHRKAFGYKNSNVEFKKSYIEDLKSANIEDESVDVVVSNCVINLSMDKEKVFKSITKGKVDLSKFDSSKDKLNIDNKDNKINDLINVLKNELKDKIKDVIVSTRLTKSPLILIADESGMDINMEKLMKLHNKNTPDNKKILEINSNHPLIKRISENLNKKDHKKISSLLLDQANILDGNVLSNPTEYIETLTDLFIK